MYRHVLPSFSRLCCPKTDFWAYRGFSQHHASANFDVVIVGGGIIGLGTGRDLINRFPNLRISVVEKEDELSKHQSGHNSGVIHTGIYYQPGSLKAKLCVEGLQRSYEYFDQKKIPFKKCGKLIVAVEEQELTALANLYDRALQNKVPDVSIVEGKDIPQIEPFVRGMKAIYSPHTGIVDWRKVALNFAEDFENNKGTIFKNFEVCDIIENTSSSEYPVKVIQHGDNPKYINARFVIGCSGLQSDRLAALSGCSKEPKIIPFRGEYLRLKAAKSSLVSTNIYPVPDPKFPFLGVHFTPRMDGSVLLGPNAMLTFNREGYGKFNFSLKDTLDFAFYPGLYRLALPNVAFGLSEYTRSIFTSRQVKQLQRYVPSLKMEDVEPGPVGVRAQAVSSDGKMVDDFIFDAGTGTIGSRVLHVRNAPSPGATSSMAIARVVCERATTQFGLSSQQ